MSGASEKASTGGAKKGGNKIFGVMTKRRWFGVVVFLSAMLWSYTAGPPLENAIISNQYFKDGVTYDYNTVRFEGDLSVVDSLFKRGFWPHVFTWQIGSYFNYTEGPIYTRNGIAYFSDVLKNRIYSYAPIDGIQIALENSGQCTDKQLAKYAYPGSVGLLAHPLLDDIIFVAQHCQRRIVSYNLKTKKTKVIASFFEGKRLNSPNEMVLGPNKKFIYFTDPPFGLIETQKEEASPEPINHVTKQDTYVDASSSLGFSGIYRVPITGGKRKVELLDKSLHRPNGIVFSTDYTRLFVTNSVQEDYEIHVFDVQQSTKKKKKKGMVVDGITKNKAQPIWNQAYLLRNRATLATPIHALQTPESDGVIDGITVHPSGYLISTAPNAKICIIDEKTGELKALIKMADKIRITNVAVAGDENLYVTGNHTVWQLKLQPLQATPQSKTEI